MPEIRCRNVNDTTGERPYVVTIMQARKSGTLFRDIVPRILVLTKYIPRQERPSDDLHQTQAW